MGGDLTSGAGTSAGKHRPLYCSLVIVQSSRRWFPESKPFEQNKLRGLWEAWKMAQEFLKLFLKQEYVVK
jgi:hypothetical protein